MRTALKRACALGIIAKDPAAGVPPLKTQEREQPFLNIDEVRALAAARDNFSGAPRPYEEETRRAFLFACHTGLRISDLVSLCWEKIERNPPAIIKRQEKTGRVVHIPLSDSAQKLINWAAPARPPAETVFDLPYEIARAEHKSYRYLKDWALRAGVQKRVSWHVARRTFATLAFTSGADVYTVAELLGHSGLDEVAKYAKVSDPQRKAAIDGLPDI